MSRILPDTTDKNIAEIMGRWDIRGSYDLLDISGGNGVFPVGNNIQQMWAYHKLDGFYGFTASFGMRLVWNVPPVYQGAYILAYVPPGVPVPTVTGDSTFNTLAELMFLSGCQHVIFNLSESVAAELIVPYVGPTTFIPVAGDTFSGLPLLGNFVIRPISAARTSTTIAKLPFSAYMCLKDLRTYGTRAANASVANSAPYGQLVSQSGTLEAIQKAKVVSKAFGSISKFITEAGTYIPESVVPKGWVGAASWVAGGAGKIAELLGWSKPFAVNAITPVAQLPYSDITVADATFTGAMFAMNSDASLGKMDLSGRGIDEMQISEVLARPNLFPCPGDQPTDPAQPFFTWKAAQVHNAVLFNKNITPHDFHYSSTTSSFVANTHMSYLSSMFGRWRGSICLKFMPICTKFHSGRIRAVFTPWGSVAAAPANVAYAYTHIIDVRDSASWELQIPYMAQTPWLNTTDYSGALTLYVDTPLVASSGAVDNIDIAVFVYGGRTLEFAIPGMYEILNPYFTPGRAGQLHSQSGIGSFSVERVLPVPMAPDMDSDSILANSLSMGDPVRSLRALCKKFWVSRNPVWQNSNVIGQLPIPLIPSAGRDVGDVDMISIVAGLYAFWRGGMRIYAQNYFPARASSVTTILGSVALPAATPNGQFSAVNDYTLVSSFAPIGMSEPTKIELPYNFDSMCRNTFIPGTSSERVLSIHLDYYLGSVGTIVQRAMADDFDMGNLVGAPMTGRF